MSAPNFKSMLYDMPMVCGRTYNQIKESSDEPENFNESDYYFESEFEYQDAEELAAEFTENLKYHDVRVEPGYYDSFQFFVEEKYSNYFDLDNSSRHCIDNDDAHYYFDVCRSIAIRQSDREKQKIKRWLLSLKEYGYNIVDCLGIFSNGEAVYFVRTCKQELSKDERKRKTDSN